MAQCATENENDLAYVPIADNHKTYVSALIVSRPVGRRTKLVRGFAVVGRFHLRLVFKWLCVRVFFPCQISWVAAR